MSPSIEAARGWTERRWVAVGAAVVVSFFAIEVVVGEVRQAVSPEPSYLQKVETCFTERKTPFQQVVDDPIALTAKRGAVRATVYGNPVTVALGASEKDAERIYSDYAKVASDVVGPRLDLHRKVVLLWDYDPTPTQREFMYLCTMDAQN